MSRICIFTVPHCIYCDNLKRFLREQKVRFEEINVSRDKEAKKVMIEQSGQKVVPILKIDDNIVIGFNRKKICKLLGIA